MLRTKLVILANAISKAGPNVEGMKDSSHSNADGFLFLDADGRLLDKTRSAEVLLSSDTNVLAAIESIAARLLQRRRGSELTAATLPHRHANLQVRASYAPVELEKGHGCIIVTLQLETEPPDPRSWLCKKFGLTNREAEIALLIADRLTNPEIAAALSISEHTVRHHLEKVLYKVGAEGQRRRAATIIREAMEK